MTTYACVLKNLFPFQGFKPYVLEAEEDIVIGLKSRRNCGICPNCRKRCSTIESKQERLVRDLDLGEKRCFLRFNQKKIRCSCGYRGTEQLDFIAKYDRVTTRLANKVARDCEEATVKEVSARYRLNWKTVKEIDMEHIRKLLPKISELNITRLAIDEIALMKGHKYLTIIRDFDTGITLKVFYGRGYEETFSALRSLEVEILQKITHVSLDMWDPYIKAINECCPNVKLVFDKFHVIKKVSEALDQVRKNEFKEADDDERKNMKKKRWIILKNESRLTKDQKETLEQLMKNNQRLYQGYLLKEQIISIFADKTSTFQQIVERIRQWLENVFNLDLDEFSKVVTTIRNYLYGIHNYFRYGMTNAIAEGFNTKINIIKRRAFGYGDIEYFMLKIHQSTLRRLAQIGR